jgi:outer membrane protein TolC
MGLGSCSHFALALSIAALVSGCVLAPKETSAERRRLDHAGRTFQTSIEKRQVPDLPMPARWRDVLHRALLANGDLEAAYFQWNAAMAQIPQVASWPNSNLAPSFSYMFSDQNMKSWDRVTGTVQFDPAENLELPFKRSKRGQVALAQARAAGARFREAKFLLQRQVLQSYVDIALMQERVGIQRDNVSLLKLLADSAADRVRAGANQQDLLRAQTQYRLNENDLANMESQLRTMKATLNGMLARDPQAPLELPPGLPPPRQLAVDDSKLIAVATSANPQLERLAREVEGKQDALELARMMYIPDINPIAGFTGSVSQTLGAMVMLPTNVPRIRGMIDEARAMVQQSQAMLRQSRNDRAAAFVAALIALRNAERQTRVFEETILPRAEQTLASSRQAYATGTGTFIELIDAQRTLLDVRLLIAETRAEREKRLAELEELAGVDIETLAAPTSAPATSQASTTRSSR